MNRLKLKDYLEPRIKEQRKRYPNRRRAVLGHAYRNISKPKSITKEH